MLEAEQTNCRFNDKNGDVAKLKARLLAREDPNDCIKDGSPIQLVVGVDPLFPPFLSLPLHYNPSLPLITPLRLTALSRATRLQ